MADTIDTAAFKAVLKNQYHASLLMLREAIEKCPDELWYNPDPTNAFWQVAYHAVFFTHFYLCRTYEELKPWPGHQGSTQNPDGIPGRPDPDSTLPLVPEPYTREQALTYWTYTNDFVDPAVDAMDLGAQDCGFPWYRMSKLEHQLVNLRHLQHHLAQLADRIRSELDMGVTWVGGSRPA